MDNVIKAIEKAKQSDETFFGGGKLGYDVIVFDNKGKIQGSGKYEDMIKQAERLNYACAYLVPIIFSQPKEDPTK